MQAVQRFEREKRVDGGKKKEEVDDPHTSAAKRKRPLRNGAELLPAERPSCSCVAACIRHYASILFIILFRLNIRDDPDISGSYQCCSGMH